MRRRRREVELSHVGRRRGWSLWEVRVHSLGGHWGSVREAGGRKERREGWREHVRDGGRRWEMFGGVLLQIASWSLWVQRRSPFRVC